MGLRYVSPGFWGLYLDSLLADGQLRVALHEVRQTLIKNPHLDWARLAMARLPLIWEGLHVYGLTWHEDQGVQALIEGLSERPRPKLAALLGLPASPKKAAP
jgi:hypothetical protein